MGRAARPAAITTAVGVRSPAADDVAETGFSAAPVPGESPIAPGAPPVVASTLGVDAYDFGTFVLRLTRSAVPAGNLTIYFRNHDASEHNLWLDPPALGAQPVLISHEVGENGGATKTVAVSAGTWRLYCSLAGHGTMTRDLAVR